MTSMYVEPEGAHDHGPCECCGDMSRSVSGFVHEPSAAVAGYRVHWTLGGVRRHGAHFDLIVGPWGSGASPSDRWLVTLEFRLTEDGPSFMVVDSAGRDADSADLVGRAMSRDEVIGTEIAQLAFAIVDTIWLQDERISEIVHAS